MKFEIYAKIFRFNFAINSLIQYLKSVIRENTLV